MKGDMTIAELAAQVRAFTEAREWERYHSPKNLAMALGSEAGEVLDLFRWLTEDESRRLTTEQLEAVAGELSDTLWFLVRLIDELDIDIDATWRRKLAENHARYAVEDVRGSAEKR